MLVYFFVLSHNKNDLKRYLTRMQKKILMMEDEDVFVEMFGERLKKDGYQIEFVKNGLKGLRMAMAVNFDLLIIDAVLPTMTGEEIIQQIKLEKKKKSTPIIVLSASFEGDISRKVKELQVNSFFIKTQITPDELAKEVKKILAG